MNRNHVDHIKGKRPAHSDHRVKPYRADKYMEGGDAGFNHRDGTIDSNDSLSPAERGDSSDGLNTNFGGGLTVPKP